jgi:hypothetical protein
MTQKLIDTLERDIRNQKLFDSFKHISRKDRLMLAIHANARRATILFLLAAWAFFAYACHEALAVECPDPGVKCKVLFLNPQEEQMLMIQNGILDTAAQGRSLDLGQFSVYLKTRIGAAPQGEVKPLPAPPAPPSPPKVDSDVPANVTPN